MLIPFISSLRIRESQEWRIDSTSLSSLSLVPGLERRKGGGGGHGGGGGRGTSSSGGRGTSSSGKGKGSSGSGSRGSPGRVPLSGGKLPNGKKSATSYGAGGGRAAPIPSGQLFAGRMAGGGNRGEVYGNRVYGSGYPDIVPQRGVRGLGLPFYFWPVVWPGPATGDGAYLHDPDEYGAPENSSRPGGPLASAQFRSNNTGSTFFVLSDQSTISSLIGSVNANCSSSLDQNNTSRSPTPYTNSSMAPLPEQALQYYRASSVVLTLDGYNDTAALNGTQNLNATGPTVPFPSGMDMTLLTCLNETIGRAVPLVDAGARTGPPAMHGLVLAWVLVAIVRSLF